MDTISNHFYYYQTHRKALNSRGGLPAYQGKSNSEYRNSTWEIDSGVCASLSRGEEPRPPAKVLKSRLSGKGSEITETANILVVCGLRLPLPLSIHFGTLAGDLGCFPFDDEAYPPPSDS